VKLVYFDTNCCS